MPLVVFNLTTSPVTLANGHGTVIPAGPGGGQRGKGYYTSGFELQGLSAATYQALQAQVAAGLVEYDWSTGVPEFFIGALEANPAPTVISPIDLYISPTGDDNTNNGTSPASPFATWTKALAATPAVWRNHCRHHLAAGTIQVGTNINPQFQSPAPDSNATPLVLLGDVPTDVGGGTQTEQTGGSTIVLTALGTPFVAGALRGAALRVVTSSNPALVGFRTLVRDNTTSQVTLNSPAAAAIPVGTTWVVERPSTVLTWAGGQFVFGNAAIVGLKDIKILVPTNGNLIFTADFFLGAMENVEIDCSAVNANITVISGATARFFAQGGPWTADGASNPFNTGLRLNCGVYIHTSAPGLHNLSLGQNATMFLAGIIDGMNATVSDGARVATITSYSGRNTTWTADLGASFDASGPSGQFFDFNGQSVPNAANGVINYTRGAVGFLNNCDINNSGGHAVKADRDAVVNVAALTGAGNGQPILSGAGASIIAGASPGNVRVTGLAGMTAAYVGDRLRLSGSAVVAGGLHNAGNNDSFPIAQVVNANTVDVQALAGFPTSPDAGPLNWTTVGGVGLRVANGGLIQGNISAGAFLASVAGTGGQTLVGNQTLPQTYAAVYGTDGNGESDLSGPTGNRIGILNV